MHVLLVAGAQTDAYTTPIFEKTRKKNIYYILQNKRINISIPMQNILEPDMTTEYQGQNIFVVKIFECVDINLTSVNFNYKSMS